jgi:hypothetical protein
VGIGGDMNSQGKKKINPTSAFDRTPPSDWGSDKLDPSFMEGLVKDGVPAPSSGTIAGGASLVDAAPKSLGGSNRPETLTESRRQKKRKLV